MWVDLIEIHIISASPSPVFEKLSSLHLCPHPSTTSPFIYPTHFSFQLSNSFIHRIHLFCVQLVLTLTEKERKNQSSHCYIDSCNTFGILLEIGSCLVLSCLLCKFTPHFLYIPCNTLGLDLPLQNLERYRTNDTVQILNVVL